MQPFAVERGPEPIMPETHRPVLRIEVEREEDGRWLAEVPALPGVLAYGVGRDEAVAKVEALALRVLAERIENGEAAPELGGPFAAA